MDEFGPLNPMPHPGRQWAERDGRRKDPDRDAPASAPGGLQPPRGRPSPVRSPGPQARQALRPHRTHQEADPVPVRSAAACTPLPARNPYGDRVRQTLPHLTTKRCRRAGSRAAALARLLDPDPVVRGTAARDALREVTHHCGAGFLQEYRAIRAFRDLRPALFSAVRPLLGHNDPDVRHAALVAAIPLSEHPDLVSHRGELVDHARRSRATSTDRHNRNRILDALKAWGYDTDNLESAADIAAREQQARRMAERAYRAGIGTGGHCEDPPF